MHRDVLLEVSNLCVLFTSCSTSCVLQLVLIFVFFVVISVLFALPIGSFMCLTFLVEACSAAVDTVLVLAVGEALGLVVGTLFVPFLHFCFVSLSHFCFSLLHRLSRCVPKCWPVFLCRMGWKSATGLVPGKCVCVVSFYREGVVR